MSASIQVERVATLVHTKQWAADFALLVSLLGEPTVVDDAEWAQFDVSGGRVCLAPAGDGEDGPVLMLKVANLNSARQWLVDNGCTLGANTQGAHEARLRAYTPGGSNLLLYQPTGNTP